MGADRLPCAAARKDAAADCRGERRERGGEDSARGWRARVAERERDKGGHEELAKMLRKAGAV